MKQKLMPSNALLMMFGLAFMVLAGCKKDPCKEVECLNGGVCIEGTCDCPEGYSGTRCETYDPCHNITCVNGNCVNGSCNCDPGYTGADCSQKVTPVKMLINKIVVKKFPPTDNGGGWDISDGPDIFASIYKGNGAGAVELWSASVYYENATSPGTYEFDVVPALEIFDVQATHLISLYDYDTGLSAPDDWMGGVAGMPYSNSTNGFPTVLKWNYGEFEFDVYVQYVW